MEGRTPRDGRRDRKPRLDDPRHRRPTRLSRPVAPIRHGSRPEPDENATGDKNDNGRDQDKGQSNNGLHAKTRRESIDSITGERRAEKQDQPGNGTTGRPDLKCSEKPMASF